MLAIEFKNLQIGSYITDVEDKNHNSSIHKEDYCLVLDINMRMGQMKLKPFGTTEANAYWIHYDDYDMKDEMSEADFNEFTL